MAKSLLILHVLTGIIFVGPVTVAVSLFPRYARLATGPAEREAALAVLRLLRRISVTYAVLGISVPVLGVGVATELGVLSDGWLIAAMLLTLAAAGILALLVLPAQGAILEVLHDETSPVLHAAATLQRDRAGTDSGPDPDRDSTPDLGPTAGGDLGDLGDHAARSESSGEVDRAVTSWATHELDRAREAWVKLTVRLSMASGIFALLWAVVVALMVIRPGSTTSV